MINKFYQISIVVGNTPLNTIKFKFTTKYLLLIWLGKFISKTGLENNNTYTIKFYEITTKLNESNVLINEITEIDIFSLGAKQISETLALIKTRYKLQRIIDNVIDEFLFNSIYDIRKFLSHFYNSSNFDQITDNYTFYKVSYLYNTDNLRLDIQEELINI